MLENMSDYSQMLLISVGPGKICLSDTLVIVFL